MNTKQLAPSDEDMLSIQMEAREKDEREIENDIGITVDLMRRGVNQETIQTAGRFAYHEGHTLRDLIENTLRRYIQECEASEARRMRRP
jgi:hypothetical protein